MASPTNTVFVGIDVQVCRPLAVAVFDADLSMRDSFWIEAGGSLPLANLLLDRLETAGFAHENIIAGIDAPSRARTEPRPFYWDSASGSWRSRKPAERGWGRHCEVIVSSSGLAKPQWTPPRDHAPRWMNVGFCLFAAFSRRGIKTHEVFPSAAYNQMAGEPSPVLSLNLASFSPGPKDMLDACTAAMVVREFHLGRGCRVGADGLGTITLPRPLPAGLPDTLLEWPAAAPGCEHRPHPVS
jgi:predicted nuclease with RNAse H fold